MLKSVTGRFSMEAAMNRMLTRYLGLMDFPKDGPTRSNTKDLSGKQRKKHGVVMSSTTWNVNSGAKTSHQEVMMALSSLLASKLTNMSPRGKKVHMTSR